MTETTSADLRTAALLLLIGGIVFLVGAFWPPWEQWYSPLKRSLQVIGEHRAAWYWIHTCFVIGVVLTMLGFFILMGTVVNNSTLIVHQALNHMREENMEAQASIREATRNRIRPIFMTIGSNVFGMLPLVLFAGAGSEFYRGLGAVVLGVLIVSTIFTLFLVPALFSLMLDLRAGLARRLGGMFGKTPQVAVGE